MMRDRRAEPVAIVGMAALLPQARNLREFWTNVVDGRDCLEPVPASRWDAATYYSEDPRATDRTYATRGGFLPDVSFDPMEMGLPPSALPVTDVAQLVALLVARDALADAGCPVLAAYDHSRTGTILAVAGTTMRLFARLAARLELPVWDQAMEAAGVPAEARRRVAAGIAAHYPQWDENAFPGFLANVVAGRIANRFDLGGPSFTLDAACAGSLHAVRAACAELRSGACDLVLAGGVDTDNSVSAFVSFSKTPALSRSGRIRPFDAGADGTLIAEGLGMLALRRLDDAQARGDRIYAVLRGVGASSDGRGAAIYVPAACGQERALRAATDEAGMDPATVGLIEAHATGTVVGDAVEIEALRAVYRGSAAPVAIGSVKSQIGHAKAAAGAASLIKTALALHQRVIPPSLGVRSAHPGLEGSGYRVPGGALPWVSRGPRRAGVSAFGFGGANVHAVLEEAPPGDDLVDGAPLHARPACITLRGASRAALAAHCRVLAEGGWAQWPATDGACRIGLVAHDAASLRAVLSRAAGALEREGPVDVAGVAFGEGAAPGSLVVMFSGQGGQSVGMGARLALDHPEMRAAVASMGLALREAVGSEGVGPGDELAARMWPLPALAAAGRDDQRRGLQETLYAQAAVGALAMGMWRVLHAAGVRAELLMGHSFGELPALWAAGALDDAAYAALVAARGRALTPPAGVDAGGLFAVAAGAEALGPVLAAVPGLEVANLNAPGQTVVGGAEPVLAEAEAVLTAAGFSFVRLPVAAAFHTASVGYARAAWERAVAAARMRAPAVTVLSNAAAAAYPADLPGLRGMLTEQPFRPVAFARQVLAAHATGGRLFLEVGPRATLTRFVGDVLGDRPHEVLATDPNQGRDMPVALQSVLARLFARGVAPAPALPGWAVRDVVVAPRPGTIWLAPPGVPPPPVKSSVAEAPPVVDREPVPAVAMIGQPVPVAVRDEAAAVGMADIRAMQRATAAAHEAFLAGQVAIAQTLGGAGRLPTEALALLREAQEDGSRLHAAFLDQQAVLATMVLGRGSVPAAVAPPPVIEAPVIEAPVVVAKPVPSPARRPATPEEAAKVALERLTAIVAERTGYPTEFIEPGMDLEADLGLDSIKRVEILAAIRGEARGLPAGLASARTLGTIAAAVALHLMDAAPEEATLSVRPANSKVSPLALLRAAIMERTGYPEEVLLPDTALEADLGIDSIKRAEIMSAVAAGMGVRFKGGHAAGGAATLASLAAQFEGLLAGTVPDRGVTDLSCAVLAPAALRAPSSGAWPGPVLLAGDGMFARAVEGAMAGRDRVAGPVPWPAAGVPIGSAGTGLRRGVQAAVEALGGVPGLGVVVLPSAMPSRAVLGGALGLLQAMAAAMPRPATLAVIGRLDGRLGTSGLPGHPAAFADVGGLAGLLRCLARESPGLRCRFIDASPDWSDAEAADAIVAELANPGGPDAVGLGPRGRMALRASAEDGQVGAPGAFGADDVILLTGGGRGITALCARALAEAGAPRLLLLGRAAVGEAEPAWASGRVGLALRAAAARALAGRELRAIEAACRAIEAGREIGATLAACRAAGAAVDYLRADLLDRAAVAGALAAAEARFGPVTGLVHGAGALADRLFAEAEPADVDTVLGPKLDGLDAILDGLKGGRALRRIMLFSSTAASQGNAGQGLYALANEALSRRASVLAAERPGARVVSVGWGPWRGGMVDEALARRFAADGVRLIAPEQGQAMFLRLFLAEGSGALEVLVGDAPFAKPALVRAEAVVSG